MKALPNHTWKYDEVTNSFISIKDTDLQVGDIIIINSPRMGHCCKPKYVTKVWEEYGQRCFTSRNMEEFQ